MLLPLFARFWSGNNNNNKKNWLNLENWKNINRKNQEKKKDLVQF